MNKIKEVPAHAGNGGKAMSMMMRTGALLGLMTLLLGLSQSAYAVDPDATNNFDSLRIRMAPNADYGVTIDTANEDAGGYIELGSLNLYVTTQTVRPATVTIVGSVSSNGSNGGQELDMSAEILGTSPWTFDNTPSTDATLGAVDELAMYVLFSATSKGDAPSGDDFANGTADASFQNTPVRIGASGSDGDKHELQGAGTVNMDNKDVDEQAHMWFLFRLPNVTSTGGAQDIYVTLTATGNNL